MKITKANLEFLEKFPLWTSPNGEFSRPEFFVAKIFSILQSITKNIIASICTAGFYIKTSTYVDNLSLMPILISTPLSTMKNTDTKCRYAQLFSFGFLFPQPTSATLFPFTNPLTHNLYLILCNISQKCRCYSKICLIEWLLLTTTNHQN